MECIPNSRESLVRREQRASHGEEREPRTSVKLFRIRDFRFFKEAVLRRRHARMFLEVAGEERLVGEVQLERDFLHTFVGGAKLHLDFLDAAGVDMFFRRMSGQVLYDG